MTDDRSSRFARMLIPIDGSATSLRALETGVELATAVGSHVTALYVKDASAYAAFPGDLEWEAIGKLLEEESSTVLEGARATCEQHGVPCDLLLADGHPAHEIIEASASFDLVVMGTHGRSGLKHLLMGSVSEKVIRHASCPVLVVRHADDEP